MAAATEMQEDRYPGLNMATKDKRKKDIKHKKKIEYLAKSDDVRGLKHYLKKHKLTMREVQSLNRKLLHACCKKGSDACLRFLLRSGFSPLVADKSGDLPLHTALYRAAKGRKHAFSDLVQPLLDAAPDCLDSANNSGRSPRELIDQLLNKHRPQEKETMSPHASDEMGWNEKLRAEMENEYSEGWGRYEDDFCQMDKEPETYDNWADKLSEQYRSKHQHHQQYYFRPRPSSTKAPSTHPSADDKQREFIRNMQKEHQEYIKRTAEMRKVEKCKSLQVKYEKKFEEICQADDRNSKLSYKDVPWPVHHKDGFGLEDVVLSNVDKADKSLLKRSLRDQQVRWHPDRFMQKFGERLEDCDRERILKKVNTISQELNQIIDKYNES